MLNGELIEALSACPLDMEVLAQGEYDYMPIRAVVVVRTVLSGDVLVIE